ncbi:MAG: DNA-binding protein [Prevotellaceae bacterium]|nr:DNA-binding protein [Prevotella sp.]MDD7530158.1 DNA-binding protein [Prevotellaceae bacterium]MDY2633687.1 HU family DNA-binding protein [Prevotella sp.]
MIEFDVKSKTQPVGKRKGKKVYFAYPKPQQYMTYRMVVDSIVRETSLSAGDVSNAIISLAAVMRDALHMGMGVDLGELGSFRLVVPPRMMDSEEEVTVESLKKPRIVYTPRKDMRDAAGEVELHVAKKKG